MVKKQKKYRSNSLSRKRALLSAVLVVLLLYSVLFLLVSVFSISSPYRVDVVSYDFAVKDNVGVNVDVDSLHFGGGPQGVILQRSIILSAEKDSTVSVFWEGPGNLSVDKNNFDILAGENSSVTFYLLVPSDLAQGNYSGNVTFSFFE